MSKNKKPEIIPNCKLILLGDSGVGKSSIIGRYISGIFMNDNITSSGASYSQKVYENKGRKVRLNIWDTAGQEKFRALGRNFYKDAYIICLVFDLTNKKTFENIKQVWYPEIKKFGEKYNILSIVGNKCDLYENEAVEEDEINSFAEKVGGIYYEISAKNGNGIDEMFESLAKMYLEPDFNDKLEKAQSLKEDSVKLDKRKLSKRKKKDKNSCC